MYMNIYKYIYISLKCTLYVYDSFIFHSDFPTTVLSAEPPPFSSAEPETTVNSAAEPKLTHPAGPPSCRRCRHQRSWWRNPVCSEAACGAEQPDRMHFPQLRRHKVRTKTSLTFKYWTSSPSFYMFIFSVLSFSGNCKWTVAVNQRMCVCVCVVLHLPLQFFAILNMLAALAYISQASSTLWFPL